MKRLMLAGSLLVCVRHAGFADGLFWVVGNRADREMRHRHQESGRDRRHLVCGWALQIAWRCQSCPLDDIGAVPRPIRRTMLEADDDK